MRIKGKVWRINFNSRKVKNEIERIRKEQQKCLERKDVDYEKLSETFINI